MSGSPSNTRPRSPLFRRIAQLVLGAAVLAVMMSLVLPLAPAEANSVRPGPSNTGVPKGTPLRVHYGNLKITKPGTVIDRMDVRGYIEVRADNVTIKRSIIRGGSERGHRALIMSWWGAKNLRVMDSTLRPSTQSLQLDGISGGGFVAQRVNISGVVDPVKVIGNNVYIQRSWLQNTVHSDSDPFTRDGKTHDDGVQITGGWNVHITDNTFTGAYNAAVMISSANYVTGNIHIKGNWISGGACAINVTTSNRGPIKRSYFYNNQFTPGRYGKTCAMRLPKNSDILQWGNRFVDGAKPRPVYF